MSIEKPWNGRVMLVTGPTGGLGGAFARAAAERGATVVLAGRRIRQVERLLDEIIALGSVDSAIYPINFEGATPLDYEELFTTVERECGRLDLLFHGAAQFEGLMSIEQMGAESWLKPFQVNCHAAQWLTQTALPLLLANKGQIVFPLEDPERIQNAYWNAYGASKAAVAVIAHHYSEELETRGVRVHEFHPGPMRTQLRARAYFGEDANTIPTADSKLPPLLAAIQAHWS
ncbi:SDR family NAD(P)-dependent oxidoreductase [Ahniella affigens]|nr:SDR family NAD(P)-dependent oxidoreductase [Ahniella affigens]